MKNKKLWYSIICVIVFGLALFLILFLSLRKGADQNNNSAEDERNSSVFVWNIDEINYTTFEDVIDFMEIGTIYLCGEKVDDEFSFDSKQYQTYYRYASKNNIKTYIIYTDYYEGANSNVDNDTYFSTNEEKLKKLVDDVDNFNNSSYYKLSGVASDWEFHTKKEYGSANRNQRIEMLGDYVEVMKNVYTFADENNLELVPCIPTSYDTLSEYYVEDLIQNGSHYIQLMNYQKSTAIADISKEMEFAKKYNKPIENIVEIQKPTSNFGGVTDEITFYNDGIDKCIEQFESIAEEYNYDKLKFSYHYYTPLVELLQEKIDFSQKYTYELYPKDAQEGNSIEINSMYLTSDDDEKIYAQTVFNAKSMEYISTFYGLKYEKEYRLVVEDENYSLNQPKIIIYSYDQSKDNIRYDEIYCNKKG